MLNNLVCLFEELKNYLLTPVKRNTEYEGSGTRRARIILPSLLFLIIYGLNYAPKSTRYASVTPIFLWLQEVTINQWLQHPCFFKKGLSALVTPIFFWLQLVTGLQPECHFSGYRYLSRGTAFPTILHRRLGSDFVDQRPGHPIADCAV